MAVRLPTATRNALTTQIGTLTDAGAGAGKIRFYTGSQPASANDVASGTLVADAALPDPSWGAPSAGVSTLNDPASVNATAAGVIGWARVLDSNNNTVVDLSVSGPGGGGDLIVSNTNVAIGQAVDIQNNVTITMPAG